MNHSIVSARAPLPSRRRAPVMFLAGIMFVTIFVGLTTTTSKSLLISLSVNLISSTSADLQHREWSYPLRAQQHTAFLANQSYPIGNVAEDPNVLFIDGREECHRMRGFLTKVRQSGFLGLVVLLVYYAADVASCSGIVEDFMPMEVFYCDVPVYEPTLLQYHGVAKYFEANPSSIALHPKAAIVKPDDVVWCQNPFPDVPLPPSSDVAPWDHAVYSRPTNLTIYAVIGYQSDVGNSRSWSYTNLQYLNEPSSSTNCKGILLPSGPGKGRVMDHFLAGPPSALLAYVALMRSSAADVPLSTPRASFAHVEVSNKTREHAMAHVVQIEPRARYVGVQCRHYVAENSSNSHCLSCKRGTFSLLTGTSRCLRKASSPVPNYTPYCKEPYRYPLMEVPSNMSLAGHAYPKMIDAARRLRAKGLFSEPLTNPLAAATARCPHGRLGVVSMMTGYRIHQVGGFIASFLSYADPHCTKLIMLVSPSDGLEAAGEMYPERVEVISLSPTNEYAAVFMKNCKAADKRFEVLLNWLAKNHRRFRYVMSIDSRDYLFLSDPLAQLVKILDQGGYKNSDFVSAVAEAYPAGASTHPHYVVADCLKMWLRSCGGVKCYEKIARSYFTNGEPLAVLNSGHIIGTAVGLLHYYRFHVRMMNESGHKCDGSDQGLFTYYMYGMLQEAGYPHKILVLSTSRSGFTNMPMPHRIARMEVTNGAGYSKKEYTMFDCDGNIVAGLHQFDRYNAYDVLKDNTAMTAPWQKAIDDGSFERKFPPPTPTNSSKTRELGSSPTARPNNTPPNKKSNTTQRG